MKNIILLAMVLLSTFPGALLSQDESPPQGGPLQPFVYLVGGTWVSDGEIPGFGEFTAERTYNWTLGNRFIEQTHIMRLPNAEMETMGMIGWNPKQESVVAWGFGSDGGIAETSVTHVSGEEFSMEGVRFGDHNSGPIRSTFQRLGDNEFMEVAEIQSNGEWVEMFTFRFKRVAGK